MVVHTNTFKHFDILALDVVVRGIFISERSSGGVPDLNRDAFGIGPVRPHDNHRFFPCRVAINKRVCIQGI